MLGRASVVACRFVACHCRPDLHVPERSPRSSPSTSEGFRDLGGFSESSLPPSEVFRHLGGLYVDTASVSHTLPPNIPTVCV